MGIDSIGGGGPKPPGDVGALGKSTGEGFRVDGPAAPGGQDGAATRASEASAAGSSDLDRLASGELSFDSYVELRLDRALSHLNERLDPDQLSAVREQLRDQMSTDPTLVRLLEQATGQTEKPRGPS